MPRQYGRQRARTVERGTRALELWLHQGMSYREIGAEMNLSRSAVGALVRGALQRAARDRDALAHTALDQTLATIDVVRREAYEVLTRVCPACHGHGTRNNNVCKRCEGVGYWYDPAERRRWADRLLRAADQRSKLLGEYAPQDHRLLGEDGEAVSLREILLTMTPDEVAREAQYFLRGVDAGRATAEGATAAVTTSDEGEG